MSEAAARYSARMDGWMAHSPGHFTVKPSNGPGNDLGARLYSVSGVKVPTKSYICMSFILGQEENEECASPGVVVFMFWEWKGNGATLG